MVGIGTKMFGANLLRLTHCLMLLLQAICPFMQNLMQFRMILHTKPIMDLTAILYHTRQRIVLLCLTQRNLVIILLVGILMIHIQPKLPIFPLAQWGQSLCMQNTKLPHIPLPMRIPKMQLIITQHRILLKVQPLLLKIQRNPVISLMVGITTELK